MAQKAKIMAVNGNGNGTHPAISNPDDFPLPIEGEITVQLSTGRVVRMLVAEMELLYEIGEIPNELTRIAARELLAPSSTSDAEREKRYKERLRLVDWLVGRVLIEPRIEVDRLYRAERWEIYNMANSPALALDNFRRQQARHVGVVPGQQDVGYAAEPTAESATAPE